MDDAERSGGDIFHPGGRLDLDRFSESSVTALREMLGFAVATHWDSVRTPHLFMGLLAAPDGGVRDWGRRLKTDLAALLRQFHNLFSRPDLDDYPLVLNREFLSDNLLAVLRLACRRAGSRPVTPVDLLVAVFDSPGSVVAECFARAGMPPTRLSELAALCETAGPVR